MQKLASQEASRARMLWPGTAGVLGVQFCTSDRRLGPARAEKTSRGRTALLALDAELRCSRNCARTRERESRLKRRNLDMMLFLGDVRVKENRGILLCKRSSGEPRTYGQPAISLPSFSWRAFAAALRDSRAHLR